MHLHHVLVQMVPQAPISSPLVPRLSTRIYPLKRETGRQQSVGRLHLHPVESRLDGVPSTLFTFRKRPLPYPTPVNNRDDGSCQENGDIGGRDSVVSDDQPLQAGLVEESDLQDVASLLIKCFPQGVILAEGEFSDFESSIIGAPLEITNKYMEAMSYFSVLYSLKARCGHRLSKGDFSPTSDSLVIAIQDQYREMDEGMSPLIGVVELQLREPDGSLPSDLPFRAPWRPVKPKARWEPYMCNLAVDERYRGQGFGRQLVRLCEFVARNQWGYDHMYLHVNLDDKVADGLYDSMGYKSLEQYDVPRWMRVILGMPLIRCKVKALRNGGQTEGSL